MAELMIELFEGLRRVAIERGAGGLGEIDVCIAFWRDRL